MLKMKRSFSQYKLEECYVIGHHFDRYLDELEIKIKQVIVSRIYGGYGIRDKKMMDMQMIKFAPLTCPKKNVCSTNIKSSTI